MKASDRPQFSAKWWTSEQPEELRGSDLDKAIPIVEKALANQKRKSNDPRAIDDCLTALKGFPAATNKTIRACDKRQHVDVIKVLKKFDALVKSEVARLEDLKSKLDDGQSEEEDDVSDDKLFDAEYRYKMMKLMKSAGKELRFGFGLNTNAPETSVLLLRRKGKPELLFKALKKTKQFSNRLLTYGYAKADPDDGQTLIFRLEAGANEPPRILKLGRKFLRADKKLRFKKLKLILPSGRTLEDSEPDTDDADAPAGVAGAEANLSRELASAENFVKVWDTTLRQVSQQVDTLRKAMEQYDDPAIRTVYDGLANVMEKFPDLDLSKLVAAARANDRAAYNQTLQQTAREVNQVHNLLARGPLLSTIDENPFVRTSVHSTVNEALNNIVAELGV